MAELMKDFFGEVITSRVPNPKMDKPLIETILEEQCGDLNELNKRMQPKADREKVLRCLADTK